MDLPVGLVADLRMIEVRCDPPSSAFMPCDAPGVLHEWRSRRLMVRLVRLVLISCLVVHIVRLFSFNHLCPVTGVESIVTASAAVIRLPVRSCVELLCCCRCFLVWRLGYPKREILLHQLSLLKLL